MQSSLSTLQAKHRLHGGETLAEKLVGAGERCAFWPSLNGNAASCNLAKLHRGAALYFDRKLTPSKTPHLPNGV